MCFFSFIFPNSYNLYKFTCSIEHISIYWSLVFISLRIYRKSSLRIIRYILSFTLAYIAFFLFSSLRAPILILLSFIISDVYGIAFDKIFYVADEKVDKTYNRLCFCKTMEEFQNEYIHSIKKYTRLKNAQVKIFTSEKNEKEIYDTNKYKTIIPIKFSNKIIGSILVEDDERDISIAELNYLYLSSEKIGNLVSNIRLNSIYEELRHND